MYFNQVIECDNDHDKKDVNDDDDSLGYAERSCSTQGEEFYTRRGVVLHKERSSTQGGQIAQLNPEQCALRPLPPPPSFYVLPPSSRKGEYDTRQYISVQCVM